MVYIALKALHKVLQVTETPPYRLLASRHRDHQSARQKHPAIPTGSFLIVWASGIAEGLV